MKFQSHLLTGKIFFFAVCDCLVIAVHLRTSHFQMISPLFFWGVYQNHMLISYLLMPVPMSHFVDDSQPLNENSFNQDTTF